MVWVFLNRVAGLTVPLHEEHEEAKVSLPQSTSQGLAIEVQGSLRGAETRKDETASVSVLTWVA